MDRNIFKFGHFFISPKISKNRHFSLVQAKAKKNRSDRSEHYLGRPIGSSLLGVHSPSDAWSIKKALPSGRAAYPVRDFGLWADPCLVAVLFIFSFSFLFLFNFCFFFILL
jgi:hypothetical protein